MRYPCTFIRLPKTLTALNDNKDVEQEEPSLLVECKNYSHFEKPFRSFQKKLMNLFIFIVMLGGGTLWHLQKFLQYVKHIIFEFTLSIFLL
jgi:hypothetical protein